MRNIESYQPKVWGENTEAKQTIACSLPSVKYADISGGAILKRLEQGWKTVTSDLYSHLELLTILCLPTR